MPIGTGRTFCLPWDMKKKAMTFCALNIMMLGMAACGPNTSSSSSRDTLADPRTLARPAGNDGTFSIDPPPSASAESAQQSGPFAAIKPLEIKPGGSLGSLGLNLKPLLGDSSQNADTRFNRLESAVVAMQEDLKTLAPSMQRLALIERDLEDLVTQLEILLQEESGAPATPTAVVPPPPSRDPQPLTPDAEMSAPASRPEPANIPSGNAEEFSGTDDGAVMQAAPAPQQEHPPPTGLQATSLRFGEHADKTRIVIDLNGPVTYRHDLDNGEKLLVIELEKSGWSGATSQSAASPLVQSWSTQKMEDGGTRLIVVLRRDTTVLQHSLLKPDGAQAHYRLMLDLKK